MGIHKTARFCWNGHKIRDAVEMFPGISEDYCTMCGKQTITSCPKCSYPIQGAYVSGASVFHLKITPGFCGNCGKAYPWTESAIEAVRELANLIQDIEEQEVNTIIENLPDLLTDTPKSQVAIIRTKQFLNRAGKEVGEGIKQVLIGIVTEAAKKGMWGG